MVKPNRPEGNTTRDRKRYRKLASGRAFPVAPGSRGILTPWAALQGALVLFMLMGPAAAGEIYTWTDGDGTVHISDQPPKDHPATETVVRYSSPSTHAKASIPAPQQITADNQGQTDWLAKRLERLKARKSQLEVIVAQNQAGVAEAQKEVATLNRRSGSYARRNRKIVEWQLMMLQNNLITYLGELKNVDVDIEEVKAVLEATDMTLYRPKR